MTPVAGSLCNTRRMRGGLVSAITDNHHTGVLRKPTSPRRHDGAIPMSPRWRYSARHLTAASRKTVSETAAHRFGFTVRLATEPEIRDRDQSQWARYLAATHHFAGTPAPVLPPPVLQYPADTRR